MQTAITTTTIMMGRAEPDSSLAAVVPPVLVSGASLLSGS